MFRFRALRVEGVGGFGHFRASGVGFRVHVTNHTV